MCYVLNIIISPICVKRLLQIVGSSGLIWITLILFGTPLAIGQTPPASLDADFFESRIRPILIDRCYSCHSAQAEKLKGGLLLDSSEGILRGGEHGPILVPLAPEKSRLIEALRWEDEETRMPPKKQLEPTKVEDFVRWVEMGATLPTQKVTGGLASKVTTKGENHWAFKPPRLVTPPVVKGIGWVNTPIDAFVLHRLETEGLDPSPAAEKRVLIRRAYYDLTGLPPHPEVVEAFVRDTRPQAYVQLVEKLLASPQYGERWGRHWLDVARYADTKGYIYSDREEGRFVHSHLYRDWVVQSFNRDLPYDRFLLQQLAADRLELTKTDQNGPIPPMAGLGFLTLGRRFLGVTHDIIDDRIDVVMRGMQGLTVACARCHDHKFDPIPTQDYYSLYGVFNSSSETMVRLEDPNPQIPTDDNFETELKKRQKKLTDSYEKRKSEVIDRLRSKVRDYWLALPDVDKLPTEDHYEIRGSDDINPTVVRQWQQYLFQNSKSFHPVFAPWHVLSKIPSRDFSTKARPAFESLTTADNGKLNPIIKLALEKQFPTNLMELAQVYGDIFHNLYQEVAAAPEPDRTAGLRPDQRLWADALFATNSPARVPRGPLADTEWFFDEGGRVEFGKLQAEIERWINQSHSSPPFAVIMEDRQELRNPRVFKRGNPASPGEEVPRQYLQIIDGPSRKPFQQGSGRLEMAQAIASPLNPLTARVMVNRVWLHHFGRGLVSTPSDFGTRADPPSHPELLDYLAVRFMQEGWSIKKLHRLIMFSNVYRQSSNPIGSSSVARTKDPDNALYWRMNSSRMHLEPLRDSVLQVSGSLDQRLGGRPSPLFDKEYSTRRALYGFVDRQFLPGAFRVFDFPNPDLSNPQRVHTTVPQQALFLMNNAFLADNARNLLSRPEIVQAKSDASRIEALYRLVYQRAPEVREAKAMRAYFKTAAQLPPEPSSKLGPPAWSFGHGKFDTNTSRLSGFMPLPHFTGQAWQGGAKWPDSTLGWVQLTAEGGHAGDDQDHAAVRRWTSPITGTIRISGKVEHSTEEGDGVRAWIVSNRLGVIGHWIVHNRKEEIKFPEVSVITGDTIDFVVDRRDGLHHDEFLWAPKISFIAAVGNEREWNAKADFSGPPIPPPTPLTAWENFAQSLLLANEFVFID